MLDAEGNDVGGSPAVYLEIAPAPVAMGYVASPSGRPGTAIKL